MAVCLISEILFEHKEDIREHLAALLHILTIILDSMQPILQQHAQQVTSSQPFRASGPVELPQL